MNKIIGLVVVVILVAGGFWFMKDRGVTPTEVENIEVDTSAPVSGSDEEMTVEEDPTIPVSVKEFTVDATTYSFTPKTMIVNKGDTVKITLRNAKGTHDLKIDEFAGAATRILNAGEEQTITFVADKSGDFEYYCSVGNHRAMGMVGTLTVQ